MRYKDKQARAMAANAENLASSNNAQLADVAPQTLNNFTPMSYLDSIVDNINSNIIYTGSWSASTTASACYGGTASISNTALNYLQYTFIGTGINAYASQILNGGKVDIYIDNVYMTTWDSYNALAAPSINQIQFYTISNLTYGSHTIKIEINGTKNVGSTDIYLKFDYFQILNTTTLPPLSMSCFGKNEIIVAASNSTSKDKALADYVCNGVNDQIKLQAAIDYFSVTSGKVKLCNGDYSIDALYQTGSTFAGQFGLVIKNVSVQREVIIEGANAPLRQMTGLLYNVAVGAVLHLNPLVYNALTPTQLVTMIGVLPLDLYLGGYAYPAISLIVNNLGIVLPGNANSIIMVDAFYASTFKANSIIGSINVVVGALLGANINCIGIRGLNGCNYGEGYRIDNCFIYGVGIPYNLSGEHLIMQNCGCRYSTYSYAFGLLNAIPGDCASVHPMTLINCCAEGCTNGLLFGTNSYGQCINLIDYNLEPGNFIPLAFEQVPGNYHGTITYTSTEETVYTNSDILPFWTTGQGTNFKTINTHHLLAGTTAQRPTTPNLYQKYIDNTLSKEILIKTIGNSEVDTLTITSGATTSGNITVTLNGVATLIAVNAGDTAITIGNEIKNAAISNWVINGVWNSLVVACTKIYPGVNSTPIFSGGTTGVAATFAVTIAGTNNIWMDAMGTTV